jgi:hypothetical protein
MADYPIFHSTLPWWQINGLASRGLLPHSSQFITWLIVYSCTLCREHLRLFSLVFPCKVCRIVLPRSSQSNFRFPLQVSHGLMLIVRLPLQPSEVKHLWPVINLWLWVTVTPLWHHEGADSFHPCRSNLWSICDFQWMSHNYSPV